jgi:hypothetical protein
LANRPVSRQGLSGKSLSNKSADGPQVRHHWQQAHAAEATVICYNDDVAERYDVILVGGGIIGSSAAMALAARRLKVAVVDVDLSGRLSSSEKNAGGVRATWVAAGKYRALPGLN